MTRVLPGVYTSIQDLSALPEGETGLSVGIVIKANKGSIGVATLQTSPQDLLAAYTFLGTVAPTDDYSFHTAIKVLGQTNQLYVSRAAKNALYGGLIIKKEDLLGNVLLATTAKVITVSGDVSSLIEADDTIRISGTTVALDGRYTVDSLEVIESEGITEITVSEAISANYTWSSGDYGTAYKTRQPVPFSQESLGEITVVDKPNKKLSFAGDVSAFFLVDSTFGGDKIEIVSVGTGDNESLGIYTVVSSDYDIAHTRTDVVVAETVPDTVLTGQIAYRNCIADPNNYNFKDEDLVLLTGIDQGSYNGEIKIDIVSTKDSTTLTESNCFQIKVIDSNSNETLETFLVSRDMASVATDGSNMYIEDVVEAGSGYIRAINNINIASTELPCSTTSTVEMSGGFNGDTLVEADLIEALNVFSDKVIPVSLLANGSIESAGYQSALVDLCETRQDCFAFLNSRLVDEQAPTPSARATNIASYKKGTLSSTSFYSAMYAPHVTIADIFNSRNIVVGADAKAIPGWLSVINNQGYPFACAGYQYGKVQGVTCSWKIGPDSGSATTLNDSSVNFIAFDAVEGSYLFYTQNTLQMANSALRDIGVVLNVLDMKQHLSTLMKQYLQLPITKTLRRNILFTGKNYMNTMKDSERVSDFDFKDVSNDSDISNNILRYILTISPTKYAQKIYLVMNIVNNTFDFRILQNI